ncbi:hypothetical protein B0H67DRAFT_197212 [Lasiosphaeris hirsuta]|uniref:Uncharacterized protein n=1 Tax=Lasiosphaeris hirsuta TaxID=260670 RepID=A0AA40ARF3_9PEZI|nr:hypothetical protein B0H67DRAFT_197212 [Lasiosphaeris hirsuta]
MKAQARNAVSVCLAHDVLLHDPTKPNGKGLMQSIDRMGAAVESDEDALDSRHMQLASRRRKNGVSSKSRRRRKMRRRSPIADDDDDDDGVVQPPPVGRNHQVDFPAISALTLAGVHYAALPAVIATKGGLCAREYLHRKPWLLSPLSPAFPCPLSEQYIRWRSEPTSHNIPAPTQTFPVTKHEPPLWFLPHHTRRMPPEAPGNLPFCLSPREWHLVDSLVFCTSLVSQA